MKHFLLFAALALGTLPGVRAGDPPPGKYLLDGRKVFFMLPAKKASQLGSDMAEKDFAASLYRLLTYGEPGPEFPSEKFLRKTCGIRSIAIAGCVVSEGLVAGTQAYNARMKELLVQRLGEDVFAEAEKRNGEN